MRRSAGIAVGIALLLMAAPAGTAGRLTPAAAPFAEAWANVPASVAARRARNIVVYGVPGGRRPFAVGVEALGSGADAIRGAFHFGGVWVKQVLTDAKATATSLSYTISPKAFWYWGGRKVPVTYRDFVYTLQQIDGQSGNPPGAGMGNLDPTRYTHEGDKQVRFFWRTSGCSPDFPCGPFANWQSLFQDLYPAFALTGVDFAKLWTTCICGYDGKPVADGPFYLAAFTPGEGSVMMANPFWGGRKSGVAEVVFKNFSASDPTSLVEAMRLGEIDATYSSGSPSLVTALVSLFGTPGIGVAIRAATGGLEHLEFREGDAAGAPGMSKGASNPLLRAPWMRQAIALAIDRRALIASAYGRLPVAVGASDSLLFAQGDAGYRPDFSRWDYDPRRALAILKGHCTPGSGPSAPDPASTKIWKCAGLPAMFRWTWTAGNDTRTAIEQIAKGELRSIGIALVESPLAANVIFTPNGLFSGDFDMAEFAVFVSDPGDWTEQYRCHGLANYTGFCSAKVDALLRAGNSDLVPARRIGDYQAADRILSEDVPAFPLFRPLAAFAHRSDLLGTLASAEYWHWRR
jgi:ABC-type transport system substrate-binding protein